MSVYYKWYRSLFGCTRLKIDGEAETVINELSRRHIYFWGTSIDSDGKFTLYGSVLSADKIIQAVTFLGFDVEVIDRKGIPFFFEKYKKRYGIIVGVILAWAILFLSSLTVWEVRVAERSGEDSKEICALLEECGLKMGTFLPSLNVREVENQFLLNNPQYSFLAVNVYGTVANIEVRRASQKTEAEDKSKLCNVIAKKEGVIISVEAYGGTPVVKKGERVSVGDLLISSYMEGSFGVVRYVHAYGKVTATVNYEYKVDIPLKLETTVLTGRETEKTSFRLLCFSGKLYGDEKSPYVKSRVESTKERVCVFGIKLPLEVERLVYYEEEKTEKTITEKEAERKALTDYEQYKARELKGELISEAYEFTLDEEKNVLTLKAVISVAEDIGEKEFIE